MQACIYHKNRVSICMCDRIETAFLIMCSTHVSNLTGRSGKNHFHEINGDGWQGGSKV